MEVDEIRFTVFQFVERGFFAGGALNVSERVIVVDGGDKKRFPQPAFGSSE